jgi:hypothetical protein
VYGCALHRRIGSKPTDDDDDDDVYSTSRLTPRTRSLTDLNSRLGGLAN